MNPGQAFVYSLLVLSTLALAESPEAKNPTELPEDHPCLDDAGAQRGRPRANREAGGAAVTEAERTPAGRKGVAISLGASKNASGIWALKVTAAGGVAQSQRPLILIDSEFKETSSGSDGDSWVEITATATVKGLLLRNKQPPSNQVTRPLLDGYKHIPGLGYYKVHFEKLHYGAAVRRCEAEGTHLLIINSDVEAEKVVQTSGLDTWFWVGFEEYSNTQDYVTVLGQPLHSTGYVRWDNNEPTADLHCGVARSTGLLGTGNCNFQRGFICEYDE